MSIVSVLKILNPVQRIVCAPVYTGNLNDPDGQGDVAEPADVFKALCSHMRKRRTKVMHDGDNLTGSDIKILGEYMTGAAGCDMGPAGGYILPQTWVMVMRLSPALFKKVQSGELTGLSMSGRASACMVDKRMVSDEEVDSGCAACGHHISQRHAELEAEYAEKANH